MKNKGKNSKDVKKVPDTIFSDQLVKSVQALTQIFSKITPDLKYKTVDVKIIAEQLKNVQQTKVTLLIGAGVSVTAGIPLANGFVELIEQRYPLLCRGCPTRSYPHYMFLLSPGQRRDLIAEYVDKAKINWAHLALGALVKAGHVDRILTTNFDPLVVKTLALFNIHPSVYDFAASQIFVSGAVVDPSVFYLHGQRGGFVLLNTPEEITKHAEKLGDVFIDSGRNRIWIIVGYSGRNDPVFLRLAEIKEYRYKLFWVGYKDNEPDEHVLRGILPENKYGYYVKGYDADSFFLELISELKLPMPDIVSKPFSHLKESVEMITEYPIKDKTVDPMKETKKWIFTAIQGFEEGRDFSELAEAKKEVIDKDELIRKTRDIWLSGKYEMIDKTLITDVQEGDIQEAKDNLFNALNSWGLNLKDLARQKEDNEAEGLLKQALEKFEAALEIIPNKPEAVVLGNWGYALEDLAKQKENNEAEGLLKQALEKCEAALKINPNMPEVLNNWGFALVNLANLKKDKEAEGLLKQALEKFEAAVKINPNIPEVLNNWGYALVSLAKQKEGKEATDLIVAAREKSLLAEKISEGLGAYSHACIESLNGNTKKALVWLEKYLLVRRQPFQRKYILKEKNFANIRELPEFKQLLEKYRPEKK
jgi:tetratricopeptide (TPR) repeat protein